MDIENKIAGVEKEPDPKFLAFKEIMTGRDYAKSNYELRFKALQNFEDYDCYESRGFLRREVARYDECNAVRELAHDMCVSFNMNVDPYRKPRKIIHHEKYSNMRQRMKELFIELEITNVEQLTDSKCVELLEKYRQRNPKYYDIIRGHYAFMKDSEINSFLKRMYNGLFHSPPKNKKVKKSNKPTK